MLAICQADVLWKPESLLFGQKGIADIQSAVTKAARHLGGLSSSIAAGTSWHEHLTLELVIHSWWPSAAGPCRTGIVFHFLHQPTVP
jgi:hypothetical protein